MNDTIVKKMSELGFTQYEARAYICMLQNFPATRYEISKKSGIPRSAIYDVIYRLEKFGAVNAISAKPEKYVPLPPDKFIRLLESRYKNKVEAFHKSVSDLQVNLELENLWNITGYQNLLLKAKEMISNAGREIYLSAWNREVQDLKRELKAAVDRGVKLVLFSFTNIPEIGLVFSYGISEKELAKAWDHKIILVRDQEELLMGEANKRIPRKVAWTHNKAIVMIAANHIVLDITLYGLRMGEDVSEVVIESHPGELELLGRLLKEQFPGNPSMNLNFSKNNSRQNRSVRAASQSYGSISKE